MDGEPVELAAVDGVWRAEGPGELVDLAGLWSLPGLCDAHAHLAQDEMVLEPGDPVAIRKRAYAYLEKGVFLCLDKGWCDESVLELRSEPLDRRPDLQAAGRIIASSEGYYPDFAVETDDEGLAEVVRRHAERSAGWVKLIGDWPRKGRGALANFGEEALRRAVAVAHASGARVAVHTMAPAVASEAVRAGVDSIEHGLFLTEPDLETLVHRQGAWVPTVLRMEQVLDGLQPGSSGARLIGAGLERVRHLLPLAEEMGATVLAGTDLAVAPGGVAAEVVRLAAFGLSPEGALAAGTTAARSYAGPEAGFADGLAADLVAFDADPRTDLGVLTRPAVVVRAGRMVLDRR